ncbi:MAG: polysaccharide deacetylase family protein [Arcanobacterium sp.]|nr:polysaccharide deacetylase family protein [Arcanobacterium sp.]MDY5589336.1 polysaccharide deacetylase family protein [Arcanobacterium sp.]
MKVAITFDDGPNPATTKAILRAWDQYFPEGKATWLLQGNHAVEYPDLVRAIVVAGHEVGNHTWSHPHLSEMGKYAICEEIDQTDRVIRDILGDQSLSIRFVRPPYGEYPANLAEMINREIVLWTIDSRDWAGGSPSNILERILLHLKDGSVVLMHDWPEATVAALPKLLHFCVEHDVELVGLGDIAELNPMFPFVMPDTPTSKNSDKDLANS